MELPASIKRSIRKYEPICVDGATYYPICVGEWESFSIARAGFEVMQQALPVRFAAQPLLSALWQMDCEDIRAGQSPKGYFSCVLLFLALSLRLGEGLSDDERVKRFRLVTGGDDPSRLTALRFTINGEETFDITPLQFARLRPILAAQNCIHLASALDNPDLVEAERDIAQSKGEALEANIESLIASIAALSHTDESEIDRWPILKLYNRRDAYERALDYLVCGIAQAQGAKWKNGNPVPSIFYNRSNDGSSAVMALSDFAGGEGAKAVGANAGNAPPTTIQQKE